MNRYLLVLTIVSSIVSFSACSSDSDNIPAQDKARHSKEVKLYDSIKQAGDFKEHKNMLLYKITKTNAKGRKIVSGQTAYFHYKGNLMDDKGAAGKQFDTTYDDNRPLYTAVNTTQLIQGWAEGMLLLKEGEKAIFIIKPEYAYGSRARTNIPALSHLIFDVHVTRVDQY